MAEPPATPSSLLTLPSSALEPRLRSHQRCWRRRRRRRRESSGSTTDTQEARDTNAILFSSSPASPSAAAPPPPPSSSSSSSSSSLSPSPPPITASVAPALPSDSLSRPSRRRLLVAFLFLTFSLGLTPAVVAQVDLTLSTSITTSLSSHSLAPSTSPPFVQERNFPPTRLHSAKLHGALVTNGVTPKSTKVSVVPSASYPKKTSAAVFASHQSHDRLSSSNSRQRLYPSFSTSRPAPPMEQTQPRLAFAYLEDLGLNNKLPFKSSMTRAGRSWNQAVLRPDIDAKGTNVHRGYNLQNRKSAQAKGIEVDESGEEDLWEGKEKSQDWEQKQHTGHQPIKQHKKDGDGERRTDLESSEEDGRIAPGNRKKSFDKKSSAQQEPITGGSGLGNTASIASMESEEKERSDEASVDTRSSMTDPGASNQDGGRADGVSSDVVGWSSFLLSSGRSVARWIKQGQSKDESGIALTMLKPKLQKPNIGRVPLIPNDSKRDFVWLILGCLALCCVVCILWSSRVTPEEYERARRLKEYAANAAAKARSDAINEWQEDDHMPTGLSSSSRPALGYSRSRAGGSTMSRRQRTAAADDLHGSAGGQNEESENESLHLGMDRRHAALQASRGLRRGSLLGPGAGFGASAYEGSNSSFLSSVVPSLLRWYRRRNSNPEAVLPLSSELSRSSTPNPIFHAVTSAGSDSTLSSLMSGRRSRSNSITAKWKLQASTTLLPTSILDSRTSSTSSLQSLVQKVPFRSITPQPLPTSTQRQREREKTRMLMLEVEKKDEAACSARVFAHAGYETLNRIEGGHGDGHGHSYAAKDASIMVGSSGSASGSYSGRTSGEDELSLPGSSDSCRRWSGENVGGPDAADELSTSPTVLESRSALDHPGHERETSNLLAPSHRLRTRQRTGSGESTPRASEGHRAVEAGGSHSATTTWPESVAVGLGGGTPPHASPSLQTPVADLEEEQQQQRLRSVHSSSRGASDNLAEASADALLTPAQAHQIPLISRSESTSSRTSRPRSKGKGRQVDTPH